MYILQVNQMYIRSRRKYQSKLQQKVVIMSKRNTQSLKIPAPS